VFSTWDIAVTARAAPSFPLEVTARAMSAMPWLVTGPGTQSHRISKNETALPLPAAKIKENAPFVLIPRGSRYDRRSEPT